MPWYQRDTVTRFSVCDDGRVSVQKGRGLQTSGPDSTPSHYPGQAGGGTGIRHIMTVDRGPPRDPSHYSGQAGGDAPGPPRLAALSTEGDTGKVTEAADPARDSQLSKVGGEGWQLILDEVPAVAPASTTHRGDGRRHGPAGSMVCTAISSPYSVKRNQRTRYGCIATEPAAKVKTMRKGDDDFCPDLETEKLPLRLFVIFLPR